MLDKYIKALNDLIALLNSKEPSIALFEKVIAKFGEILELENKLKKGIIFSNKILIYHQEALQSIKNKFLSLENHSVIKNQVAEIKVDIVLYKDLISLKLNKEDLINIASFQFNCPITKYMLQDACMGPRGVTYSQDSIIESLKHSAKDPVSMNDPLARNSPLTPSQLRSNDIVNKILKVNAWFKEKDADHVKFPIDFLINPTTKKFFVLPVCEEDKTVDLLDNNDLRFYEVPSYFNNLVFNCIRQVPNKYSHLFALESWILSNNCEKFKISLIENQWSGNEVLKAFNYALSANVFNKKIILDSFLSYNNKAINDTSTDVLDLCQLIKAENYSEIQLFIEKYTLDHSVYQLGFKYAMLLCQQEKYDLKILDVFLNSFKNKEQTLSGNIRQDILKKFYELAIHFKLENLAVRFLEAGAFPNLKNSFKAIANGFTKLIVTIFNSRHKCLAEFALSDLEEMFVRAAYENDIGMVKAIYHYQPNININCFLAASKNNGLHLAIAKGNLELFKFFLEMQKEDDAGLEQKNIFDKTPFDLLKKGKKAFCISNLRFL